MMKFDLAPLLLAGYKRFIVGPLCVGVVLALLLTLCGYGAVGLSLVRGFAIGTMDSVLLLAGVRKAMPYVEEPEKGLRIMRRYRYYRIAAAASIIILLLRQGYGVAIVFIGLLLTHILFILNLTLIAYRLNKEDA